MDMILGSSEPSLVAPLPSAPSSPIASSSSFTPMPVQPTPTGDAWDPLSRTPCVFPAPSPQTNTVGTPAAASFLQHSQMQGQQFYLTVQQEKNRKFEFCSICEGIVKVRDGSHVRDFPLAEVSTCMPTRKQDLVVCVKGEHFTQMFLIKTFGPDVCVLRKFGVPKTTKIETLYTLPTLTLAVIYPPTKH